MSVLKDAFPDKILKIIYPYVLPSVNKFNLIYLMIQKRSSGLS